MPSAQRTCNSSDTARLCRGQRMQADSKFRAKSSAGSLQGWRWRGLASAYSSTTSGGRIRVWRKRQALSTSSTREPDLISRANGYLSLQSNTLSSASVRLIRLQLRCNLDSRRDGAYTFFSTEFAIWRGRWRRPCVKCAFILTPAAARAAAKTIIYSK